MMAQRQHRRRYRADRVFRQRAIGEAVDQRHVSWRQRGVDRMRRRMRAASL